MQSHPGLKTARVGLVVAGALAVMLCCSIIESRSSISSASEEQRREDKHELLPERQAQLTELRSAVLRHLTGAFKGTGSQHESKSDELEKTPDIQTAADEDEAEATEVAFVEPLGRADLDRAVDHGQPDVAWTNAVRGDFTQALQAWPSASAEVKCTPRICRANLSATSEPADVDALFDRINAMNSVEGERMIALEGGSRPVAAVVYFSRNGAISLSDYSE